jgi:hypothetical protein
MQTELQGLMSLHHPSISVCRMVLGHVSASSMPKIRSRALAFDDPSLMSGSIQEHFDRTRDKLVPEYHALNSSVSVIEPYVVDKPVRVPRLVS